MQHRTLRGPLSGRATRQSATRTFRASLLRRFAILLLAAAPITALATDKPVALDIAASDLATALNTLALDTGAIIYFDASLTEGKRTAGLRGEYPVDTALSELLQDAGLQAEQETDGSYHIVQAEVEEEPEMLPPLTVEGVSESVRFWFSDLPEAYEGGQVARGGRMGLLGNQDVFDTPFNVTNYTAELIENQQATMLSDVVRNDSSVRQLYNSRQGNNEAVQIRGFFASHAGALYDGMSGLYTGISSMSVGATERVEVFKGPNALLNNSVFGGLGGKINLVPKRPLDTPLTRLITSYDSRSTLGVHTDLSRRFGSEQQFGARLNMDRRGGESVTKGNKAQSGEVALALDYRGEQLKLEAILDHYQRDTRGVGNAFVWLDKKAAAVPTAPDFGKNINQPWEKINTNHTRALLRAEYKLGQDWTAHAAFGTMQGGFSSQIAQIRELAANGDFKPFFVSFGSKRKYDSWQGGIRGKFQTGGIIHQLALEIAQSTATWNAPGNQKFASYPNKSNIYRPKSLAPLATTDHRDFRKNYTEQNTSIAIADTLGFMDDRILLIAGLRRQNIGQKSFNRKGATTSDYDKSAVTPSVALVVKPWDQVSLYSNYIQALEQGRVAPKTVVNAGEIFPPAVTEQVEFGVKLDLDGLGLTAGVFQIERPSAFTNASNRFSLDGKQRNRGLELNAFGELQPNLRLLGSATYINAELTRTQGAQFNGKTAIGVPALTAALNLEWDVPTLPGLTLTANARHTDSAFTRRDNSVKVPAYQLYGLGARYQHSIGDRQFTLRMNVDNLLDKDYWSSSYTDRWFHKGSPRRIAISLTMDF